MKVLGRNRRIVPIASLSLLAGYFAQETPHVQAQAAATASASAAPQQGAAGTATTPGARGGRGGGGGRGAPAGPQIGAPIPSIWAHDAPVKYLDDSSRGASYPRVIQLKEYAPGKGHLLATFSRRGSLPIYRSTDNGDSWQAYSEIQGLSGQCALYELPKKAGEFPAGTIMAAGVGLSNDPSKTVLSVHFSSDGGKTWQFLSKIDEGGRGPYDPPQRAFITKATPIWEPYLYSDATGKLVAFYSDERYKADGYNQLLDHRVSSDGGRTWEAVVFDVAMPDGLTRAGMAVVTRAGNGKFYMIYEMVGLPGYPLEPRSNPVYFRVSDDGLHFGDPKDPGTLIQDRWRQFPWATPYIVWSPWPAPNGTLIASARAIMRYDLGQVGNGFMINRNNGQGLWTLIDSPITYTPNPGGYSQTMIPLGDGQEILQLVPVDGKIQVAKFKLPEKLPEYEFPFGPKR